jgi:7-cyano-7-deazaguanine synthase
MSFDYGQRHRFELQAARRVAEAWDVAEHRIVRIDLSADGGFGRSSLTDGIDVPKDRQQEDTIPSTYVPARNTIFLSIALGYAEVLAAGEIFIGVNAVDYSGYPDCRPEFIEAFQSMANLATAAATQEGRQIRIEAPLIQLTKAEIIRTGNRLGVDYGLTHSCYDPDPQGRACSHCDSCRLRRAGFQAAGLDDPTVYQPGEA